jgi:hypothetical protein
VDENKSEIERAVVAVDHSGNSVVLWVSGCELEGFIAKGGDLVGLVGLPALPGRSAGLMVWEGTIASDSWYGDMSAKVDSCQGKWRELTTEEWRSVSRFASPWFSVTELFKIRGLLLGD